MILPKGLPARLKSGLLERSRGKLAATPESIMSQSNNKVRPPRDLKKTENFVVDAENKF